MVLELKARALERDAIGSLQSLAKPTYKLSVWNIDLSLCCTMLTSFFNELQSHKLVLLKGLELALSVALLCACSKLIDPRAIKCLEKTWIYYPALHLRSWELQERKKPQHGFALHWREREKTFKALR